MMQTNKLSPLTFFNKVLNGTAIGVIVGLLPNAILSVFLAMNMFKGNTIIQTWNNANVLFQAVIPALIGMLIASEFDLKGLKACVVAAATYVGSGVTLKSSLASLKLLQQAQQTGNTEWIKTATNVSNSYFTAGTGDIFNAMIVASLTVLVLLLIGDRLGSLNIILLPIIGALIATVGLIILPYVKSVTTATGDVIKLFTELQPYLMSVLICVSFALILMTPMSTVAIGLAIGLNGISAGAASMGVAVTTIVLVVHSISVNKPGVTVAIALGSMKMMMPVMFRNIVTFVPIILTAILCGLLIPTFTVTGVPASSGFGLVGFTAFFASITGGLSPLMAVVVWLVIPIVFAIAIRILLTKMVKLYTVDYFKFEV